MAEDDERRSGLSRSSRRDAARGTRREPPVIEGKGSVETEEPGTVGTPADQPLANPLDVSPSPSPDGVPASVPDVEVSLPEQGTDAMAPIVPDPVTPSDAAGSANTGHEQPTAQPDETASWRTAEPPAPEARRTSSLVPALLGLAVVIIAAVVVYLFSQISDLGPDQSAAVADLRTKVAALEAKPPVNTSDLAKRLDGADGALSALKTDVAELAKRVEALGSAPAPTPAPAQPPVADLTPRLAALEGQIADVKHDLADLRGTVADLPKPDFGPVNSKIGDVDQRVSSLQSMVNALPRVDLGPVTAKVDALDSRLKPVEVAAEAATSPQRVAERQAAPVAVTAQAISGAISAGRNFPQELKGLQALGVDPAALAPLQAVADSGAPTLADLRSDLARFRDPMVADGAPRATGSYVDRLVAGATSLVQVRPLGSVVGDTPAAIVARMDADLGSDSLQAALDEWQKLPEASRAPSKGLADRIKLRLDAETAAKAIAANAIGAMAAPKG